MSVMSSAWRPAFGSSLMRVWRGADAGLRRRLLVIYAVLAAANGLIWATLVISGARYPILLGLAPIAFGFGLRHAVDPDHIAAIDNTTRKLMRDGQKPVAVGFFFSLGHSTVVFALSVAIAFSAGFVRANLPHMQAFGAVIGTSISGIFLVLIAGINLIVLSEIMGTWRRLRRDGCYSPENLEELLNQRGLLARLFRPLLRMVGKSWHMYLVGLLFGLGFDTASEVGILGMSATAGAGGMPVWLILLLPLLFVGAMSLIDTTDGVAMLGAYGWARVRPARKLYYNMNITLISVIIALFIGGIEVLQVISMETGWRAGLFGWADTVRFSNLGVYTIAILLACWAISAAVFKLRGIDRLDDALIQGSAGVGAGE